MGTVTWLDAIKSFFVTIPKLLDLFAKLGAQMKEKEFQDWVTELDQTTQALEKATSLKERINAAKKLSELASRM